MAVAVLEGATGANVKITNSSFKVAPEFRLVLVLKG